MKLWNRFRDGLQKTRERLTTQVGGLGGTSAIQALPSSAVLAMYGVDST